MIKNVLIDYWTRLDSFSKKEYGTHPTVTYTDELNKDLLISNPNEKGEVKWNPIEVTKSIEFSSIEARLGFKLTKELKDYYSSYLFLELTGKIGIATLYCYPVSDIEHIPRQVLMAFEDASVFFPRTQLFLIGNATVSDDDSYFVYYSNESGETFCYEEDTGKKISLASSLEKTIQVMEAYY